MFAEFRTSDNQSVRVYSAEQRPSSVSLSIDRVGEERAVVYLPASLARAVASALMGAAADLVAARKLKE